MDGRTERAEVGVLAAALEFDAAAIEVETVRFPFDGADAEGSEFGVDCFAVDFDSGADGVEMRVFRVPESGVADGQSSGDDDVVAGSDGLALRFCSCYDLL